MRLIRAGAVEDGAVESKPQLRSSERPRLSHFMKRLDTAYTQMSTLFKVAEARGKEATHASDFEQSIAGGKVPLCLLR